MNDFLKIIIFERYTLFKGWVISTLLILPFTFLPTLLKYGLSIDSVVFRLSDSILYSFGFSALVVVVSVIQNYNNLVDRKRLFDKPAFVELDFYGRLDGTGSIVNELETFLLGKIGNYYFRLNLIEPESGTNSIEIVPLIDLEENKDLENALKTKFGFKQNWFFSKILKLSEEQLNDKNTIKDILQEMEIYLRELGVKPLEVDEFALANE